VTNTTFEGGITLVDADYIAPQTAAVYLIRESDEVAIIETGTAHSTPRVLEALADLGLGPEAVRYIVPTHVHLDHAGGASALMAVCVNAELLCHPRGARHLIDPSKLVAGAEAVYGAARVTELYGAIVPIPAERVTSMADQSERTLGGRTLTFLDTPGHARHHFCVHDSRTESVFTGDTFGLAYPDLRTPEGPFLFPTTTPVQFEPEAMCASITRLQGLSPKHAYLTHFGPVPAGRAQADALIGQVEDYCAIAQSVARDVAEGPERMPALNRALTDYTLARIAALGGSDHPDPAARLEMDMQLNAQGLEVWLQRQAG